MDYQNTLKYLYESAPMFQQIGSKAYKPGLETTHRLEEVFRIGSVDFEGIKKEVNLALVPEAKIGDYVLVHVGAAIGIIDEEEAKKTMDALKLMGEDLELEPENPS